MNTGVLWIKQQLKDRKFFIFIVVGIVMGIALCAEFLIFSYSVFKIVRYLFLLEIMFVIAWIDQHERRIPNKILLFMLTVRGLILVLEWVFIPSIGMSLLISSIMGMLLGGGLFLFSYFISRKGLGMGDVKLLSVIGCYVGVRSIMTLVFLTVLVSAFFSIIMLILKRINLKEEIPFAPFVLAGTILTMAFGM